ncbi:MAG: response regulator transcription factor [Anaerolineales bacterium]
MKERILLIDDDDALLDLMKLGLKREGFEVFAAMDGQEGLRVAYDIQPDVIVLDIMMAQMDGWATCQRFRNVCNTPIIMLSAKGTVPDVVKGLSLGADDYVRKPCSFEELTARIHAVLRRDRMEAQSSWQTVFDDGVLRINLRDGTVKRNGEVIELTPTESRLCMYLVGQKGRVASHKELLTNVWGPECAEEDRYLSVYIRYLRRKIEENPDKPHYIRTHWGVGYSFGGEGFSEA